MNKCTWDETGLKPCEIRALDCSSCDHYQEEQPANKCINCYHYKVCAGFGFILDPLHGGVICEDFTNANDVEEVKHGRWEFVNDYESKCTNCKEDSFVDHNEEPNYCPNCGAKMDGK